MDALDSDIPRRTASGFTISVTALEQLTRVSLALIVGTRIARELGSGAYGDLAIGLGLAALLLPIATMGTDALLLARIATGTSDDAGWSPPATRLRTIGTVLAVLLSIPLAALVTTDFGARRTIVFAAAAVGAAPLDVGYLRAVATHRVGRVIPIRVGLLVLGAIARLVAIGVGRGTSTIAAIFVLESLAVAALTAALNRTPRSHHPRVEMRAVFDQSRPFLWSGLLFAVYLRIDVVLVRALVGSRELGTYAIATRVSELGTVAASLAVPVLAAAIAHAHRPGTVESNTAYRRFYKQAFALGVASAAVLSVAGWIAIVPLFGREFSPSRGILLVHAISIPAVWITAVAARQLAAEGKGGGLVAASFVGAAVNVGVNFVLLPTIGAVGAAWATATSYWAAAAWLVYRSHPRD